jgi:hypothetical protein
MEVKDLHITVKEIFPIVLAVEIWGQTLSNHKVLFMIDNQAVCYLNIFFTFDYSLWDGGRHTFLRAKTNFN